MFQNIRFRDCVHRGVVGSSPEAAVAAVMGEACAPVASPVEARDVFVGVSRVLGPTVFRETWTSFLQDVGNIMPNPLEFADFLENGDRGRGMPQLADAARFDLAHYLAAKPAQMPSIGACCLPREIIRDHPEMLLRFQPGWRYLRLSWPVHRLLPEIMTAERLAKLAGPVSNGVRVGPNGDGVAVVDLAPASFALEMALRSGQRFAEAVRQATEIDAAIDSIAVVSNLVEAGAIIDAVLHPTESLPQTANPDLERILP